MQNIGFNTLPENNIITPEEVVATIEQMAHDLPNICPWVSNGLLISIGITQPFLFS